MTMERRQGSLEVARTPPKSKDKYRVPAGSDNDDNNVLVQAILGGLVLVYNPG